MFSRRNPTDPPPSLSRYAGVIVYLILAAVSVWASANSLISTFDIPLFMGYALGAVFVIAAAMMLKFLKTFVADKRIGGMILVGTVFLAVWAMSLLTNTHSLFVLSNMRDIQKRELQEGKDELSLIASNAEALLDRTIEDFSRQVNSAKAQLRSQITDSNNCGKGPKSQDIITEIGDMLQTTLTDFKAPPASIPCNSSRWANYADQYGQNIDKLLQVKENESIQRKGRVLSEINSDDTQRLIATIEEHIDNFDLYSEEEHSKILEKSYGEANRQAKFVQEQLKLQDTEVTALPAVPESTELKRISALPNYLSNSSDYGSSGLIWSFLIALVIDLAGFIVLWSAIFNSKSDNY